MDGVRGAGGANTTQVGTTQGVAAGGPGGGSGSLSDLKAVGTKVSDGLSSISGLPDAARGAGGTKPSEGGPENAGKPKWLQEVRAESDLLRRSKAGDQGAVKENLQGIMDQTREPFTRDFVESYKKENDGKAPTEGEIKRAHSEAFLKAFVSDHYGFDGTAGIDPDRIHPSFKDSRISSRLNSFPDSMDLKNPDGTEVKGVSINHLLSGIQWHGTEADSAVTAFKKYTVGHGVNSHLAEEAKNTGIFGPDKLEEPGHTGILAGSSEKLQEEFLKDPVAGLDKFMKNPSYYTRDGSSLLAMFYQEGGGD